MTKTLQVTVWRYQPEEGRLVQDVYIGGTWEILSGGCLLVRSAESMTLCVYRDWYKMELGEAM